MLDDAHVPVVTDRTDAQGEAREGVGSVAIVRWGRRRRRGRLERRRAEELSAAGELCFPVAIAEQAVVPHAVETGRQHVP